MNKSSKHEFAIFYNHPLPKTTEVGGLFYIVDREIIFRIKKVLRLSLGQRLILFNNEEQLVTVLVSLDYEQVIVRVDDKLLTTYPAKKINLFIGLLKKPAFEEVVYLVTEAGAVSITPLLCKKIHQNFWHSKEVERLSKIVLSAREQSKSYFQTSINDPQPLHLLKFKDDMLNVLCNPSGDSPLHKALPMAKDFSEINIFVGPEAGFIDTEESLILDCKNSVSMALTRNILRAPEAAFLACSMFNL